MRAAGSRLTLTGGIAFLLALFLFCAPLQAAEAPLPTRNELIGQLLDRLSQSQTLDEAKMIESDLAALWLQSGQPSIDILMQRGMEAMRERDFDRAFYYFNELTALAPGFPGAWERRAAIFIQRGDKVRARQDLETTLRLEPRHFYAMRRLASLMFEVDMKDEALALYRQSLQLDPWLDDPSRDKSAASDVAGPPVEVPTVNP